MPRSKSISWCNSQCCGIWVERSIHLCLFEHIFCIILFPKLDGWSLLSAVCSSFRHTQISYQIATNWLYIPLIIFIYIPYNYCCGLSTISKRFFQLHPTSSIVAPNGPAVIPEGPLRAGALIFSLYPNYITIVFLIIYPIYIPNVIRLYDCPHYHPNISHYIVHIAYHSYSCCQHTSILVSRKGHSHRGHVGPRSAGRQREGGALVLTI